MLIHKYSQILQGYSLIVFFAIGISLEKTYDQYEIKVSRKGAKILTATRQRKRWGLFGCLDFTKSFK